MIIQTSFIGDVVLATAVAEKLHSHYPHAQIDFLVRKGNEGLLQQHPYLRRVLVWDKKTNKYANLLRIAADVRRESYTHVINLHRFGSSGFVTWRSRAKYKAGFDKNPFSFCYSHRAPHVISAPYAADIVHEVQRNQALIAALTDEQPAMPALYPSPADQELVQQYKAGPYICIAPSSVWFTKQYPAEGWTALADALPHGYTIYLLGAPGDAALAAAIQARTTHPAVRDLCGKLSFLQSAALMRDAAMNYTNDSAPLHFATAMNAALTAVFCSTSPAFGFGPLGRNARVVELQERLPCKPCGLHGHKACPQGHFRCAKEIATAQLLWWL